jgi:hypothetical protein
VVLAHPGITSKATMENSNKSIAAQDKNRDLPFIHSIFVSLSLAE